MISSSSLSIKICSLLEYRLVLSNFPNNFRFLSFTPNKSTISLKLLISGSNFTILVTYDFSLPSKNHIILWSFKIFKYPIAIEDCHSLFAITLSSGYSLHCQVISQIPEVFLESRIIMASFLAKSLYKS